MGHVALCSYDYDNIILSYESVLSLMIFNNIAH